MTTIGSFQLQRIMSRCSSRMYYVGYESVVDSEQTDYRELLPTPTLEHDITSNRRSSDLLGKEKPVNILTVIQPDLEICTNTVSTREVRSTSVIDVALNFTLLRIYFTLL